MTNKKKIVSLYFKYFLCCLFPLSVWVWVGMVIVACFVSYSIVFLIHFFPLSFFPHFWKKMEELVHYFLF